MNNVTVNETTVFSGKVYILCEPFLLFQSSGIQNIIQIVKTRPLAHSYNLFLSPQVHDFINSNIKHYLSNSEFSRFNFFISDSYIPLDILRQSISRPHLSCVELYTHTVLDHSYGIVMRLIQRSSSQLKVIIYDGAAGKTHYNNLLMAARLQKWWRLDQLLNRYKHIPSFLISFISETIYDPCYQPYISFKVYLINGFLPYFPPVNTTFEPQPLLYKFLFFNKPYIVCQTSNFFHARYMLELCAHESVINHSHDSSIENKSCFNDSELHSQGLSSQLGNILLLCPSYKYLELLISSNISSYNFVLNSWHSLILKLLNHPDSPSAIHITLHPSSRQNSSYHKIFNELAKINTKLVIHTDSKAFYRLLPTVDTVLGETSSALVHASRNGIKTFSVNPLDNPEVPLFCKYNHIESLLLS